MCVLNGVIYIYIYIRHRASVHEVGVWLPGAVFSYRKHSTGTIREVAEPLLRISQ